MMPMGKVVTRARMMLLCLLRVTASRAIELMVVCARWMGNRVESLPLQ